jgi:serine/threonine protein kinase
MLANGGKLPLSKTKRVILVFQLCSAVRNMHQRGIFHRDLKPQNVMLSAELNILLGDFGGTLDVESVEDKDDQTGIYTWGWADSNARNSQFDLKSEIYAFALNCFYIIHGKTLFNRKEVSAYLNNTKKNTEGDDEDLLQFIINRCLEDDPNKRPDFA